MNDNHWTDWIVVAVCYLLAAGMVWFTFHYLFGAILGGLYHG